MSTDDLRERRLAVVRDHMETENRHDFDATMATFDHPRYEIIPTGDIFDGRRQVGQSYEELRAAFPDQRAANVVLRRHFGRC